jgi:hypothetical protein
MQIAQTLVAGEGDAHLHAETTQKNVPSEPASTAQSATDAPEWACDTRNLPYQTLRAHQRALSLTALPARARCALAAIAQTVDCRRPLSSVFARRPYLSERAGLSERTWYRAEQDLVDAGLITVAEQGRKFRDGRGGLFGAAYIHLTAAAAQLLGLISSNPAGVGTQTKPGKSQDAARDDDTKQRGHGQPDSIAAASGEEPGEGTQEYPQQAATQATQLGEQPPSPAADSLFSRTATVADRFTYKVYLSPEAIQKRQQARLPADVQPLVSLGFHENYVFKLMRQARVEHGKRLGDVVEACWESLRQARKPVPYLLKLLTSPTDFSWLACQRREAAADAQKAARAELEERTNRQHLAGQAFVGQNGEARYEVSHDGATLTVYRASERVPRTAVSGWVTGLVDAIRRGLVMPAAAGEHLLAQKPVRTSVPVSKQIQEPATVKTASGSQSLATCLAVLRASTGGQRALRPGLV